MEALRTFDVNVVHCCNFGLGLATNETDAIGFPTIASLGIVAIGHVRECRTVRNFSIHP